MLSNKEDDSGSAGSGGLSNSGKIGVGVGAGIGALLLSLGAYLFYQYSQAAGTNIVGGEITDGNDFRTDKQVPELAATCIPRPELDASTCISRPELDAGTCIPRPELDASKFVPRPELDADTGVKRLSSMPVSELEGSYSPVELAGYDGIYCHSPDQVRAGQGMEW